MSRSRPREVASASVSTMVTVIPARAKRWAMPPSMYAAPTTVTDSMFLVMAVSLPVGGTRQGGAQHLLDVLAVLGADAEGVAAVVLAAEGPGVPELEGPADDLAVVDDAVLQRDGRAEVRPGGGVLVAEVVLDVPEVRVREDLLEHLHEGGHGPVEPDEVAEVGVEPDGVVVDVADELDGVVGRADVGVLVHLQAELEAVAARMVAELADALDGEGAQGRVVVVALGEPEPQRLVLRRRGRLHEADVDDRGAELRREVEEPVRVGEVALPVLDVDDAAAGHGDRGDRQPLVLEHLRELGDPLVAQLRERHPGVGR